jgi:F-type H+-transporting ATPase subunit b
LEGLGINLGYLLVQIFNFLIILIILIGWMYRPILNMLEKRREKIARGLEDARVAADARANAEKEAQKVLDKARQEAAKLVREASERAGTATIEIRKEAERQAMHIREVAHEESEEAKLQALRDLRGQVASLAIAAAQKVIGETLDDKRQHVLIDEFFSGVRMGKVVLIEDEKLSGVSAEVTSALPLNKKEQAAVESEVLDKIGEKVPVHFKVDTGILGGLVIRVGDKVLDGSVAGKLESLRQTLE